MKDPETRRLEPPSMEQFKAFVRKIIAVPKKEIDKKEAAYQKKRQLQKGHSPQDKKLNLG